jgi:Phage Tail Collar Domain
MAEPIGSIIAFGGRIDPQWETTNGWMHCDGRILDRMNPLFRNLFKAIGFTWGGDGNTLFNIPDLRGYFLRGVDRRDEGRDPDDDSLDRPDVGRDPNSNSRQANNSGGATGDSVGSVQDFATALPRITFQTSIAGLHWHSLDFEINASRDVDGISNTVGQSVYS